MLFHIYLPKSMLAFRVIKLINALQFTLLCRMWAQHSKIYRIWPAFCGICIWRSPRLTDGSSRRYQKLIRDWHFEALFEKKGSHFLPNNKTRSSTCLRSELSGQWMTLLIFMLVPTIPSTDWVIPLYVTVQYSWLNARERKRDCLSYSHSDKMRTARRGHKNSRQKPSIAQP